MEGRDPAGAVAGGDERRLRRERRERARALRRRRLGGTVLIAAMAAVLGAAIGAVGGGEDDASTDAAAAVPSQCEGSTGADLRQLAGQRIVVRTDGTPDSDLLRRAERGEIAGVIVFPRVSLRGRPAFRASPSPDRGQAGEQPPLIVATDQEGGFVKRFPEAPPLRAPIELALAPDEGSARLEGRATGTFLLGLGINTNLAPVLDVPASSDAVISDRAFGESAQVVSSLGLAFADGLAKEGAMATAKHFPGLGRSVLNTDFAPSAITASRQELAQDLRPFEAAIADDIPLIMLAIASYPQIGAKGPAALERSIATRLLRTQLGYEGVSITDDLGAEAVAASFSEQEAAERAAAAGTDLLLFAGSSAPKVLETLQRSLRARSVGLRGGGGIVCAGGGVAGGACELRRSVS